jgi:hypothetical protein
MRHHKVRLSTFGLAWRSRESFIKQRTPDNLYPSENSLNPSTGWDCHDFIQRIYAKGAAQISRQTVIPAWHPFLSEIWNGTCDSGQLTRQGLNDSIRHGSVSADVFLFFQVPRFEPSSRFLKQDFWGVYHRKLRFLSGVNTDEILVRTSTELRTQHVASGFLYGMDPATAKTSFPVYAQPSNVRVSDVTSLLLLWLTPERSQIDSIVPNYVCPKANNIRQAYQSVPAWTDHLQQNADLMQRLGETLGTAGLESWESWCELRIRLLGYLVFV